MTGLLTLMLFGTAFAVSVWTIYASVRPQLHRYRALFSPAPELPELPTAARFTVRRAPARLPARMPLRAAA